MRSLDESSLTASERTVLARFVDLLEQDLNDELEAVWLYGSRARGEPPAPESDVDLIVLTRGGRSRDFRRVGAILSTAAEESGASPSFFSVKVFDFDWIEGRRAIRSFYLQEVDRDKVVLAGRP